MAATSASNPPSTPTPSTTGPTSTPRAIRGCSRRRRVAFTSPGVEPRLVPGARRPRHPRRRRDRADAADPGLALGDRGRVGSPAGADGVPPGSRPTATATSGVGYSPDGPPSPGLVERFLAQALSGAKVRVPPTQDAASSTPEETVAALRTASGQPAAGTLLDYRADIGARVRLLVLDLARRGGGSGGLVHPGQPEWLARELAARRRALDPRRLATSRSPARQAASRSSRCSTATPA